MPVRSVSASIEPGAHPAVQLAPLMQGELGAFREVFLSRFEAVPQRLALEYQRVPDSVSALAASHDAAFLPAGQGLTIGVLFLPRPDADIEISNRKAELVILLSGLGQHAVQANWLWIHQGLSRGMAVLALSIDGHSGSDQTLFDPRLATRTLPLVLDRLARLPKVPSLHVVGHGLGGTFAWLAACRNDVSVNLKTVACLAPWCAWEGQLESDGEWPPLAHPLRLCREGILLARFYGPLGLTRMWRGDSVKNLRRKLFGGTSLEAQMARFLRENIRATRLRAEAQVPVLVVVPGRGVKASQFEDKDVAGVHGRVTFRRDPVRTARGTQFSDAWPTAVFAFLESRGNAVT